MDNQLTGIVSILIALPLLAAAIVAMLPNVKDVQESDSRLAALGSSSRVIFNSISVGMASIIFGLSVIMFLSFPHLNGFQNGSMWNTTVFRENLHWIPLGGGKWVDYHVGVDGIGLLLVLLTTFVVLLCSIYLSRVQPNSKPMMALLFLLESAVIGSFCSLDLVLFYLFFETTLIPTYLLIGIYGGENRKKAALKFFLYTFVGSILMLVGIVYIYTVTGTFDIPALTDPFSSASHLLHSLPSSTLMWLFAAFTLAFAIKTAVFPFHAWLPDAYAEAPPIGSVGLVLLKMGILGLVRIVIPFFPAQAQLAAPVLILMAVVSIIYGALMATTQKDTRRIIAYSSVSHLGFVILGIFTFTRIGLMGALLQNLNHGIFTPMLFLLLGMLSDRTHTNDITKLGGLKRVVPGMGTMMLIATLGSIAVPFFSGFVGEFPVLLGSWTSSATYQIGGYWITGIAASGTIFAAVYMLWWYQRIMLGPVKNRTLLKIPDLTRTEWIVLLPMAGVIFWVGLGTGFWTRDMQAPVYATLPPSRTMVKDSLPVAVMLSEQDFRSFSSPNQKLNTTSIYSTDRVAEPNLPALFEYRRTHPRPHPMSSQMHAMPTGGGTSQPATSQPGVPSK